MLLYCPHGVARTWSVDGRVVGISDGDTITVLDRQKVQHNIRLAGIDAPEKGQPFGNASKKRLSALVFDRRVEARCHKRDHYWREVCKEMRGATVIQDTPEDFYKFVKAEIDNWGPAVKRAGAVPE